MSLIEEALRRVQTLPPPPVEQPRMEQREPPPRTPEVRAAPPTPTSQMPWLGVVIGSAGALILGWVVWTMVVLVRPTDVTVTHPAPAPSPRRPLMILPGKPHLELSGIIGGPGQPMAIINGRLLAPGEIIDGATLLDVTDDAARLRWRDEEIVLQLSR